MPTSIPLPAGGEPASASILVLAVIQGLSEFLPISSSGHLVLAQVAMGIREAGLALDIALHLGTLGAVLWAYRAEVLGLLRELRRGELATIVWLVVATIPAGVVGMLVKHHVQAAFHAPAAAGGGLLVTALVLLVGERARRRQDAAPAAPPERDLPPLRDAWILGLAQTLALLPGISRSGMTICAGLVRGLSPERAARYSFLMSIPAIAGAALVELPGAISDGFGDIPGALVLAGVAVAGVVGWACLRVLLVVMRRGAFTWFAGYCALVGTLVLALA